jgi:cell division protein FtsN
MSTVTSIIDFEGERGEISSEIMEAEYNMVHTMSTVHSPMRLGVYVFLLSLGLAGMSVPQNLRNQDAKKSGQASPGGEPVFAIWKDGSAPVHDDATVTAGVTEERSDGLPVSRSGSSYAIQIGAFAIKSNALKMQQQFAAEGYRTQILVNKYQGNVLYLVWVGSFVKIGDAQRLRKEIRAGHGIIGLIRERTSWKR